MAVTQLLVAGRNEVMASPGAKGRVLEFHYFVAREFLPKEFPNAQNILKFHPKRSKKHQIPPKTP